MSQPTQCANCGAPIDPETIACPICGVPIERPAAASSPEPSPRTEAELRPLFGEGRYSLFPDCTVGRGTDVDLSPVVESQYISRRHAKFLLQGDQWWVEALESANETRVNGVPLQAGSRMALSGGDTVNLGGVAFVFRARL